MSYLPRIVDLELDQLMEALPAIVLEGPKAVGKTATAQRRARTCRSLDDPAQLAIAAADTTRALAGERPVLLDEWQRLPEIWDSVRRTVDAGTTAGSFLLAGSASPTRPASHSGAGRIVSLRMRPLSLAERGIEQTTIRLTDLLTGQKPELAGSSQLRLEDYVNEMVQSGLPGLRSLSGRALRAQLDGYLQRIVDVDFPEQGLVLRKPETLRRWMTAYAAATATTASYETIRRAATARQTDKPARSTVQPWKEALERQWMLEPVPAWLPTNNWLNRLAQPPKHHLADPAFSIRLLGLDADALMGGKESGPSMPRKGGLLGHLFESLVTQSLRVYAQASECQVKHFRLGDGSREVDLIVERADGRVLALEVKLGKTVDEQDLRHLLWLKEKLGSNLLDSCVIHTGPEAYRRKDGIAIIPAALLGA
jgi:predicted AAA+ superfamily ATPase